MRHFILTLILTFYPSLAASQSWSTYLSDGGAQSIATDSEGNVIVVGNFFDKSVAKFSNSGALLWSINLGPGISNEAGVDVVTDSEGNIYVTGTTSLVGWISGGYDTTYGLKSDGYVVKLSPAGAILWGTYIGGAARDTGSGIALDISGNVLVTGYTESINWVAGGNDISHNGGRDIYVAKLTTNGAHVWFTYVGGGGNELSARIVADNSDNVYVTGQTDSPNWISGGFDTTYNSGTDAFILKFSAAGQHLWSTYVGSKNFEVGTGIAVDPSGDLLLVGLTNSVDWTSLAGQFPFGGWNDAFILRCSSSGQFIWSRYLGGSTFDDARDVAIGKEGRFFVTGLTYSKDWASLGGGSRFAGEIDGFLAELDGHANLLRSSFFGGKHEDWSQAIALDAAANLFVAGQTASDNWISGGYDTTLGSNGAGFVVKFDNTGPTGSLRVRLSPFAAINSGAQWRADAGPYLGTTQSLVLPVGNHFIEYRHIRAWKDPASQIVDISSWTTTTLNAHYRLMIPVALQTPPLVSPGSPLTVIWNAEIPTAGTSYYLALQREGEPPSPIRISPDLWQPETVITRSRQVVIPTGLQPGNYYVLAISTWLESNPDLRPDGIYFGSSDVFALEGSNALPPAEWLVYQ